MRSFKQQLENQQLLNALCDQVVQQQISNGDAQSSQLRLRRRHLLKALRKRIPRGGLTSSKQILQSAVMVLALWGFTGLVLPNHAEAAAVFEHTMLEGFDVGSDAHPALVDIDNDGDLDVFVGASGGTVRFYRNDGTSTTPDFVPADGTSVINPLANVDLSFWQATPAFVDMDHDGDLDVFVGHSLGAIMFYRNDGTASSPSFVAATGTNNPLSGIDVGSRAAPVFVDIDKDGDMDAFVGESTGTVKFYQNDGTMYSPSFVAADGTYVINPLAGFNMTSTPMPTFVDIDHDGDLDAFVGCSGGGQSSWVRFYQNDGTMYAPSFVAADGVSVVNPLSGYDAGSWSSPAFADIDADGDFDVFVGDGGGAVRFYQNNGTMYSPGFVTTPASNPLFGFDVTLNSSPSFTDIDNDGDLDAFVGHHYGRILFYQNNGTAYTPGFVAANGVSVFNSLDGYDVGYRATPSFVDIDDDGDMDVFVGEHLGTVKFYQNDGTELVPTFNPADGMTVSNPLEGIDVGDEAVPVFVDIDDDGDMDAFIGDNYGTVMFYQNNGSASSPNFVAANGTIIINPLDGFDVGIRAAPIFVDIDKDGDLDVFVGDGYGFIKFYQNDGCIAEPNFVAADGTTVINPLDGFGIGARAAIAFVDIDKDGDLDLFSGEEGGTVRFFENLDPDPGAMPASGACSSSGGTTGDTSGDTTSSDSSSGGGGGAPGVPLLTSLIMPLLLRRIRCWLR